MPIIKTKGPPKPIHKLPDDKSDSSSDVSSALWRRPKVREVTGVSRSGMYDLMKRKLFPLPVKIGIRAVAWRQRDVQDWIDARNTESVTVNLTELERTKNE